MTDADDCPTSYPSGPASALDSARQGVPSTTLDSRGQTPALAYTSATDQSTRPAVRGAQHVHTRPAVTTNSRQQIAGSSSCKLAVSYSKQTEPRGASSNLTAHKHRGRWGVADPKAEPAVSRAIGHICKLCQEPIM